jgi:hypothetical protein
MKSMTCLLVLAAVAAAGCTTSRGQFTRQNYETLFYRQPAPEVKMAMGEPTGVTRSRWEDLSPDVQKALGKPLQQEFDCWEYVHKTPPYYKAVIFLQDEQFVGRVWYDSLSGQPSSAPRPGARMGSSPK